MLWGGVWRSDTAGLELCMGSSCMSGEAWTRPPQFNFC